MAEIDVVVVSYNNRDTLRECVGPLCAIPGIDVTVVDNASPDDSLEAIAELPVRTVQETFNRGFGAGCNHGLAAGHAPLVLLLNPDARLSSEDLERMARVLDAEPQVVVVGPRLLDDTGALIPTLRRCQRPSSVWAQALFVHKVLPHARWANEIDCRKFAYDEPAYPEWVSGACMLVRRTALEGVGGFDEGFFLYCEDMDLCARLRAAGGRIRYEPAAIVRHRGGHSAPRSTLLPVLARSRVRYARKHGGTLSSWAQRAGIAVGAVTHAVASVPRRAWVTGHFAALCATVRREHA